MQLGSSRGTRQVSHVLTAAAVACKAVHEEVPWQWALRLASSTGQVEV